VTAHRFLSPRRLATGGAVVLAGVVGAALLLQNGGSACAAPPSTSTRSGKATFYDLGDGTGNCSFPAAPANDLFVALGDSEYSGAAACGSYLDVTGPKGKVRVKVIDSCPPCEPGHIDLSRTAFRKIADEVTGIVPVKYRRVTDPAVPGPVSVRLKEGSSRYWFAALIDHHANPLTSVKVASGGSGFRTAHREDYNYWVIDGGAGAGPFTLRLTDVTGRTRTVSGIKLSPGTTQKGPVSSAAAAPVRKKSPSPSRKPSASPSPSESATSAASVLEATSVPAEPPVALAAAPDVAEPSCG
jgi:expansin (peptidoglycan-binding protein)